MQQIIPRLRAWGPHAAVRIPTCRCMQALLQQRRQEEAQNKLLQLLLLEQGRAKDTVPLTANDSLLKEQLLQHLQACLQPRTIFLSTP